MNPPVFQGDSECCPNFLHQAKKIQLISVWDHQIFNEPWILQCNIGFRETPYTMRNLIQIQSTWGDTEPVRLRLDVCRLASFLKSSLAFSSCCSSETERCHSCLSFCSASAHWRFASSSLRHKRWQTAVHMKKPLPLLSPYARVSQTGWGNCVIIKIWLIAIIKSNPVI